MVSRQQVTFSLDIQLYLMQQFQLDYILKVISDGQLSAMISTDR